ncbi:MAG: nitrate reductase [Shinella sp.]|jgi:formylglycine-generating enzyme required for sulfatase activity|nr:MAG: nitrate reductase [Shinella sp.]
MSGKPHPVPVAALPVAVLALIGGAFFLNTAAASLAEIPTAMTRTITVLPGSFAYREAGEFYRDNYAVDGPKSERRMRRSLEIMKYQVSAADYDRCVGEGACLPRDTRGEPQANIPVTGVSFDDAMAYADWLSRKTGEIWRLPSDEELAFAAGERYPDDALGIPADSRNPALRWLADYERETARKASRDPRPQPFGSFGESESGLADFGGNVWEWTSTCLSRVNLDKVGKRVATDVSCGIYIAAGKHRSPLSSFIREPKSGGCSVGTPPDNVGFRLVRENRWYSPLLFAIRHLWM